MGRAVGISMLRGHAPRARPTATPRHGSPDLDARSTSPPRPPPTRVSGSQPHTASRRRPCPHGDRGHRPPPFFTRRVPAGAPSASRPLLRAIGRGAGPSDARSFVPFPPVRRSAALACASGVGRVFPVSSSPPSRRSGVGLRRSDGLRARRRPEPGEGSRPRSAGGAREERGPSDAGQPTRPFRMDCPPEGGMRDECATSARGGRRDDAGSLPSRGRGGRGRRSTAGGPSWERRGAVGTRVSSGPAGRSVGGERRALARSSPCQRQARGRGRSDEAARRPGVCLSVGTRPQLVACVSRRRPEVR